MYPVDYTDTFSDNNQKIKSTNKHNSFIHA